MFDLPTGTKAERKAYTRFRKKLLEHGFWQLQYSVYSRPCFSDDTADTYREKLIKWLPEWGEVRLLMFTDAQFARMQVFYAKKPVETEKPPDQLSFF